MSYKLYRNIKQAEQHMNETQYHADGRNMTNEVVFGDLVKCFNIIAEIVRFNRKLPFFNLKENWALIKSQDFETALNNVKNWLLEVDDRYDGETWTEKVQ